MIASSVASGASGRMRGWVMTPYGMMTETRKIVLSAVGIKKRPTLARKITAYAHHNRCARMRYVAPTLPSTSADHFDAGLATNSSNPPERSQLGELWDRNPHENHEIVDEHIARVAQQRLVTPDRGGYARDIKC